MTQCAKGWNALGSQCVPKRGPLCGFNIVGFEFECARLVCGTATSASPIMAPHPRSVCGVVRASAVSAASPAIWQVASRLEKREHERAEKQNYARQLW